MSIGKLFSNQLIYRVLPETMRPHKTTILKWIIIGFLIRLTIMPLYSHADHMVIAWISLLLVKNHQLLLSGDPPFIFFIFAVFYALTRPILPSSVVNFLISNMGYTPATLRQFLSLHQPEIRAFLLISKIPYMVFDFATAILLLHFVDDEKKALSVFKFWMINPISIYVSYALGQYDITPIFFLVLSLFFFRKQKITRTMLSLGIAGALKFFSMFFALPVALIYMKEQRNLVVKVKGITKLFGLSLLPLIFIQIASTLIPVYYEAANAAFSSYELNGFFGETFYSRGKPGQPLVLQPFLYALEYSISLKTLPNFYDTIYLFPLIYGLFLLGVIYWEKWSFKRVWKVILAFFLAYYAVTLFHPQWFLWAQPLLILLVVEDHDKFSRLFPIFIILYFIYILYWFPELISIMDNIGLPGIQVVNLFRSILSAVCIFTAFLILKEEFFKTSCVQ